MREDDRRFYGLLAAIFGPLFIAGGWLASFTDVGAGLLLVGVVMLIAAPLLRRSVRFAVASFSFLAIGLAWPLAGSL